MYNMTYGFKCGFTDNKQQGVSNTHLTVLLLFNIGCRVTIERERERVYSPKMLEFA